MLNVEYLIQHQFVHWFVFALKDIKEMQLFNVIEVSNSVEFFMPIFALFVLLRKNMDYNI